MASTNPDLGTIPIMLRDSIDFLWGSLLVREIVGGGVDAAPGIMVGGPARLFTTATTTVAPHRIRRGKDVGRNTVVTLFRN